MIREALEPRLPKGITVKAQSSGEVFAQVEWSMQIDGGITERNPRFNFIDTAARSLTNKLLRELDGKEGWEGSYELVVGAINTVEKRRVGWGAFLYA